LRIAMAQKPTESKQMHLLILDELANEYKKGLEKDFPELLIHAAATEQDVGSFVERTDILLTGKISDDLVKNALRLKWIQANATGVDALINLPSLRKEVVLTSARGIHGPQMSEMAILLMLSLNRRFPQILRNQGRNAWVRWPQKVLSGKKVAILGVGVVGKAIASKCKAFGMTVYGIGRVKRDVESVDLFVRREEMQRVLGEVDFLVIVVPSTPQTKKMIDRKALSAMKPTAFLLNLARGDVVDEEALIESLTRGTIAGAALDTFVTEPLPPNHPFWHMENVIITPHIGGLSENYVEQVLSIFRENLRRFLQGQRGNLINVVER
jgi:D-2-hydroxyacid dehydrogenase (NADP+)